MNEVEPNEEVRRILADLQAEIRRHRLMLGDQGAVQPADPLARVRERQRINPHLPIGWPVMPAGILPKLIAYAQKITRRLLRWYINPLVEQQNQFNAAVTDALAGLVGLSAQVADLDLAQKTLLELSDRQEQARTAMLAQLDNSRAALREQQEGARNLALQQEQSYDAVRLRLQRLENRADIGRGEPPQAPADASHLAVDTFLLGARYRNPVQMQERLGDYDDVYLAWRQTQTQSGAPLAPVLDLGCGRGELVSHLTALGLTAYGIDADADAIQAGRAEGRDLRREDAFAHLSGLPDNSLGGVIMIQVIEHFDVPTLMRLLMLIGRKLVPGGFVVAETLNPGCLYALTRWYLMDPTHKTPLNSEVTQMLMERAELWRVQIRFMHPVPDGERLIGPQPGEAAPAALARDIMQLNQFLYGPQDYAAIGYKPQE